MTRATVKFEELIEAFEFVSSAQPAEHAAFLCAQTGKIHWHTELSDDMEPLPDDMDVPGKHIAIPHKNDLDLGKALALRFVGEVLPEAIGKAQHIFSRAGAYARFKDFLEQRGLLQQWYEYEGQARERALRQWCQDSGIQVES